MLARDAQVLSAGKIGCHASQNGPANLAQTRRHFSTNPLRPVLVPPHTCFSPARFLFLYLCITVYVRLEASRHLHPSLIRGGRQKK